MKQRVLERVKRANVFGGSGKTVRGAVAGETARGSWCTSKEIADAIGHFDLDPFSNPRSHIETSAYCMLERGDDGLLDHGRVGAAGSYRAKGARGRADRDNTVWLQPPYELVTHALDHYGHTRFAALLRFDTRTRWFARLYRMSALICVLRKCEFEPPPGVTASSNPFPHALYYANADDVTDAVLRKTAAGWRPR